MSAPDKHFKIPGDQIRALIPNMGGCFATDRITVDGLKVGFMFREVPELEDLSGWTFMSGDETQDYVDNPDHWAIYDVNTICNYDPAIIPYLEAIYGSAFGRVEGTDRFEKESYRAGV